MKNCEEDHDIRQKNLIKALPTVAAERSTIGHEYYAVGVLWILPTRIFLPVSSQLHLFETSLVRGGSPQG